MDISAILVVLLTLFFPPIGVFLVAGCGADLFVNICLTLLGYLPGHVHAFYLEYVYYDRQDEAKKLHAAAGQPAVGVHGHGRDNRFTGRRAPGIYSERVQTGGGAITFDTMVPPIGQPKH